MLRGHETVNGWQEAARDGRIESVVRDLLVAHYDPIYLQSIRRNFPGTTTTARRIVWDGSDASLQAAAAERGGRGDDSLTTGNERHVRRRPCSTDSALGYVAERIDRSPGRPTAPPPSASCAVKLAMATATCPFGSSA